MGSRILRWLNQSTYSKVAHLVSTSPLHGPFRQMNLAHETAVGASYVRFALDRTSYSDVMHPSGTDKPLHEHLSACAHRTRSTDERSQDLISEGTTQA